MEFYKTETDININEYSNTLRKFMAGKVIPAEAKLYKERHEANGPENISKDKISLISDLQDEARHLGLYGQFFPKQYGGMFNQLSDYLMIAQIEGYSEFGPEIFGSEISLDIHTLKKYGTSHIQKAYTAAIADGRYTSSYGMTEPNANGSVPHTFTTIGTPCHDGWLINGRKWFICRAKTAKVILTLVRTPPECDHSDQNSRCSSEASFSLMLVDTESAGFRVERPIPLFGNYQGQCELSYDSVFVPSSHVLGTIGDGMNIVKERLMTGRLLRSAQWLGLAQRCYDLMCDRINSEHGKRIYLSSKQLIRQQAVTAYQKLISARAIHMQAASLLDQHKNAAVEVNLAKVSASEALCIATDVAIQVHGAEGFSDRTSLPHIFHLARMTRILDGAEEALVSSIGKQLLNQPPSFLENSHDVMSNVYSHHNGAPTHCTMNNTQRDSIHTPIYAHTSTT